MILPHNKDAIHKAWMYRLLVAIADDAFLVTHLRFKGGTCAAMREFIDRFSVDVDFDLIDENKIREVQTHLEKIFKKLGLGIKDKSQKAPQYFLRYPLDGSENMRNTLKLDIAFPPPKNNTYELVRLDEIDRIMNCHTIETMFANKLTTPLQRFEQHGSIAGRDFFDIHTFFLRGYSYNEKVIFEKTEKSPSQLIQILKKFIEQRVTQTHIDEDLNTLLKPDDFKKIRKVLKPEVLMFLADEIVRNAKNPQTLLT